MAIGRRFLGGQVRLTRRSWEDVAPQLEFMINRLWESEANGIPAGFNNLVPETIQVVAGDAGTENSGWAAADHVHPVSTDSATGLANASSEGVATSLARSDHKHKRDVRVQSEGVDVATRNALNFADTGDVDIVVTDEGAGLDRTKVQVNLTASALIRPSPPNPHTHNYVDLVGKQLLLPVGTSSAPSLAWAASPSSGYFMTAAAVGNGQHEWSVNGSRRMFLNGGGLSINGASAAAVILQVGGAAAQSGNLQEWQNSSGNVLSRIDKDGQSTDFVLAGQIFGF